MKCLKWYLGYVLVVNWFIGYDIGFCFLVFDGRIVVFDKDGVFFFIIFILLILNFRICKSLKDEI